MTITEEMKYGLYGQILLWVLEILPYLNENIITIICVVKNYKA
jgi:hypothetical protein